MEFGSRIKKELTEGIVRAILTDAGYRVVDVGIESVVREVECLSLLEYAGLDFPPAMRSLPDLLVMNREQSERFLVEVKYRSGWSKSALEDMAEQARFFKELVLVYLNGSPEIPVGRERSPATYLRCCRVRWIDGELTVYLRHNGEMAWRTLSEMGEHAGLWWGLVPLQELFLKVDEKKGERTLMTAIGALDGILRS